ncbi:DUF6247 family protein [Sphaerisporangium fuscum]|uniref:DUF6247 family protein n=1 Tax=Sphaerisporangium fuscum TaxID=2835868 RepID=UPI001BDCC324|nr:DUF6247 family protein [Sphaerisporangium fuscum]
MTAQPHEHETAAVPERTPQAVRAALSPVHRETFEREFRAAMAKAADDLDLAPVYTCLDYWRRLAVLKASGAYDRITRDAEQVTQQAARGELPPARSWREVLAELGVDA